MAHELVDDELWEIVQPLPPPAPPRKTPSGRKRLDERRVIADSSSVRTVHRKRRSNATDRRKVGNKPHLLVDGNGTPLNVILTGANRHDSTQLLPLLDGMSPIARRCGRPLVNPSRAHQ